MRITSTTVLKEALDIIKTRGWCQGAFVSNGSCCLLGALRVADASVFGTSIASSPCRSPKFNRAVDRVKKAMGLKTNLITWNDTEGRTKRQVENLLKKAMKVRA